MFWAYLCCVDGFKCEFSRFACPLIIAAAVCSMHYTGVEGYRFRYDTSKVMDVNGISQQGMGATTAVFVVVLCSIFIIVLESMERQRRAMLGNIVRFRTRQLAR